MKTIQGLAANSLFPIPLTIIPLTTVFAFFRLARARLTARRSDGRCSKSATYCYHR